MASCAFKTGQQGVPNCLLLSNARHIFLCLSSYLPAVLACLFIAWLSLIAAPSGGHPLNASPASDLAAAQEVAERAHESFMGWFHDWRHQNSHEGNRKLMDVGYGASLARERMRILKAIASSSLEGAAAATQMMLKSEHRSSRYLKQSADDIPAAVARHLESVLDEECSHLKVEAPPQD